MPNQRMTPQNHAILLRHTRNRLGTRLIVKLAPRRLHVCPLLSVLGRQGADQGRVGDELAVRGVIDVLAEGGAKVLETGGDGEVVELGGDDGGAEEGGEGCLCVHGGRVMDNRGGRVEEEDVFYSRNQTEALMHRTQEGATSTIYLHIIPWIA